MMERRQVVCVVAGVIGVLFACGCSQIAPGGREVDRVAADDYTKLLAMYPIDAQGLAMDDHFKESKPEHQSMTYGLLLAAEAQRFAATGNDQSRRRIRAAMDWALANADLDGDGKPGWGLPQAWDAFQDGSTNPPNAPYTITTALVLDGMMDALRQRSVWSDEEYKRATDLMGRVVVRWCNEMWSDGYGGGFFWYSPNPADAIFAVNSPSMFLGSMVRLMREYPRVLSPDERVFVQSRADAMARAIVSTVELRKGLPFWDYMPRPNKRKVQTPNDLLHHVYTLAGIEFYRDARGPVVIPWSRADAVRSLDAFWGDGQIREFPQDVKYTGPQVSLNTRPCILWGAGSMLAAYAWWGDRANAARTLEAIRRDYGPMPKLRLRPGTTEKEYFFPARQVAHVLWGMAPYLYGGS